MKLKVILLILLFSIQCLPQKVSKEYFGMYKHRFDGLRWKIARIDTHWLSKYERVYCGETWIFKTNVYDTIRQTGEELRYFFHGGQQLTAIQFIKFSYDSLEILKVLNKYAAILRGNGARGFYPNVNTGGSWPGVGGPTTSLCKVFWYEIHVPPGSWGPKFHGSVVVDFAYHFYSIKDNWPGGIQPYYVSLNFYPYNTSTSNLPPDPGYGPTFPGLVSIDNPDVIPTMSVVFKSLQPINPEFMYFN